METNSNYQLTPRPRRKAVSWKWFLFILLFCFLASCLATVYLYWQKYVPSHSHEKPSFGGAHEPIFYQGKQLNGQAIGEGTSLELPFSIMQKYVDPSILFDKESQSVIITTQNKVIQLKTNQLTGLMNDKPFQLSFPVQMKNKQVYLPVAPLQQFFHMKIVQSPDTGAVQLEKAGDAIQWAIVPSDAAQPDETTPMRSASSIKADILADLKQQTKVMIWGEHDGWYRIQLQDGYLGYVQASGLNLDHIDVVPKPKSDQPYIPWKPVGGYINLTWEQVYHSNPDTSKIDSMPGVNVISPQWFHLKDGAGNIANWASASYVKWAHQRDYQVWALFSNSFDPKMTDAALSSYDKRHYMIQQLISFAQMYHLQGINIDFENVYMKDKDELVQFIREMTPLLHEQGLVVSMDVSVKSANELWSKYLDRSSLGSILDYMIIMAYDEHWSTSPTAGSVASLPWVESSVKRIMKEDGVPASKIVLGAPLYTYRWTIADKGGRKTKVSSKAMSMSAVQSLIKDKKLTVSYDKETGQDYVQFKDKDGNTVKIWIEDAVSMTERINLVKKYGFSGLATWSREFASPGIWQVMKNDLSKRP